MELQSFRSIFAIIAIIAVVIELVTFFRKFPKPSELAFSTLVNFGIINLLSSKEDLEILNYFNTRCTSIYRTTVTSILLD